MKEKCNKVLAEEKVFAPYTNKTSYEHSSHRNSAKFSFKMPFDLEFLFLQTAVNFSNAVEKALFTETCHSRVLQQAFCQ